MLEPILKRVNGDDVEIQVAIWEGTAENNVLCIHGLAANCRSWDTVCSALAPEHYLIAMDLRGRGASDRPDTGYSVDHHAEDVRCLLDDLGIEKINLMGHSFGAFVCMVFASKYPERTKRLVLIDGGGKLSEEQIENIMPIVQLPLQRLDKIYPSKEAYLNEIKDKGFLRPWTPEIETMYVHDMEPANGGVTTRTKIACIQEDIANVQQYPLDQLYSGIKQPVLVLRSVTGVFGDKDIVLPDSAIEHMTENLSDSRCVDIVDTNHFSIVLSPNRKRDEEIARFLAS